MKFYEKWQTVSLLLTDMKSSLNAPGAETQVYVMIEASRASGYAGDIAIDDITITDNPCGKQICLYYSEFLWKL